MHFIPILTYRLPCPQGKRPQKRASFLISKQKCNILGRHLRISEIRFCQQFSCVVELFLKIGVFLLQLSLERMFAVAELFRYVVNGTCTAWQ